MKSFYVIIILCIFTISCKSDKTEQKIEAQKDQLSVAQKIANAHGFENWNTVTEVNFTFKVDVDTTIGKGRTWKWMPKNDSIYMTAGERTIKYNRSNIDSTSLNADRAFVNDKYWAFVPFQLVWDNTATISDPLKTEAPISKTEMDMITILYPNEGGYTPGDAYDIYYDKDYMIKEWSFRKGNAEEISLSTTFENYEDYKGIKIAKDHKQKGGSWNLNFTDISIKTK